MTRLDWFPESIEELSADWLTHVLRASGALGERETIHVAEPVRIGTGLMGHNYRVRLASESTIPSSMVLKFASSDATSRGTGIATGAYLREIRFYEHLAPRTTMRVPRCYWAQFDPSRGSFIVVMEDLVRARPGDQITGCDVSIAEAVIDQAVELHAGFWGAEGIGPEHDWLSAPGDSERASGAQTLYQTVWPGFVARFGHHLSPETLELGLRFGDNLPHWALQRTAPFTIVHGDYRLDNLLFDIPCEDREYGGTEGAAVCVVDWQTHNLGVGAADVAYFLGAGLLPGDRRTAERGLVGRWHAGLMRRGVTGYSWERAWEDYRAMTWGGVLMAVVASMITQQTPRGDEMFTAMALRHLQHVIDLGAVEFID